DGAGLAHLRDQLGNGGVGELAHLITPVVGFGQDDVRQPGDAGRSVDDRQSDARAEAQGDELFMRIAGHHHLTHASRRHGQADGSASPSGASRSVIWPEVGNNRKEIEHGSPDTSSSESSTSARSSGPAVPMSSVETIAASMSECRCGGEGSRSRPVIEPSPLRYDVARMLPISRSAESPTSVWASTPSRP